MENPIKMDDLGVPLFLETSIWWKLMDDDSDVKDEFLANQVLYPPEV